MIYTVGPNIPESDLYTPATLHQFLDWITDLKAYQFDLETNITRTAFGRKIRTMQFGELRSNFDSAGIRFVIHWHGLPESDKMQILMLLWRRDQKKYIHNAIFEYETMLNYNVVLENVFDTMLAEQIKWTGYFTAEEDEWGNSFFSLAGCMQRYFNVLLDKSYQTAFIDEFELTPGHIVYAADDVTYLDELAEVQLRFLEQEGLINVLNLENEAVLAFGDITWNGMLIDKEKWIRNLEMAEPVVQQYKEALNQWLLTDTKLNKKAKQLGHIYTEDTVEFNPNSPVHKQNLLKRIFPDIEGATLPIIKKYLKNFTRLLESEDPDDYWKLDRGISETPEEWGNYSDILVALVNQDWTPAFLYLVRTDKQWLVDNGYLIPEGTIKLNWNSTDQVLPLFQQLDKNLKDLSEKSRNTFEHPIVVDYEKFKKGLKLTSSYGLPFLELVDLDGRVRTRFNQILATGRISSSKPNGQQIPWFRDEPDPEKAYRYHNCFIAAPGHSFVSADYISQELVILSDMSQDPVWQEAIKKGWDLHSITASMLYGKEWANGKEPGCEFELYKKKCKCKKHKEQRYDGKTLDFGLPYGMSCYKLAGELKITVPEAVALMDKFFTVFPSIGKCLINLGGYGVQTGVIKTLAPFNRKRWFPKWDKVRDRIQEHTMGIRYNAILGEIERASRNMPIQGSAADMCKLALVYLRRYINDNNLRTKVKLSMQVHDEILCEVVDDFVDEWAIRLQILMEKAAKVIITSGLLKVDTSIDKIWTK
ncbi:unnamed protein product [Sphagnum balticum]